METLIFEKMAEIKREKRELEKQLGIKITIQGKKVSIEGTPVEEYEALNVLEAIREGFSAQTALSLLDVGNIFRKIHIKDFTRRKKLKDVRGRIIGKEGKTKRTLEDLTGASIVVRDNNVSIIGTAESIEHIVTAVKNIIRGTKQANAYRFLERMNAEKKKYKSI